MLKLQNHARLMSQACLLLGLIALTGCQQLSKNTRAERVIGDDEQLPHGATLGPSRGTESTELQPVPQQPSRAIPLLPPPAPPSDAARRDKVEASEDTEWDEEAVAEVDEHVEEFFPSSASELSRELLTARAAETEARMAEAGRLAILRRAAQAEQLPVIVPGPTRLYPVSTKEPRLMPVPR